MIIEVMNRQKAEQTKFDNDTLVISISDTWQNEPNIRCNKKLLLYFDDEENPHPNAMIELDAQNIIKTVNFYKDTINKIVVHCGAGVSRSAGVAAALGKWLNNDDSFIFDNSRFTPNSTCYRLVLNEAMGNINESEFEELFNHNIEVWKEVNDI